MQGARGLPLASTFKCRFRPDNVVASVQITEPLAGAASYQGQKGGKPPLARWATAAVTVAAAAASGCADKLAPARGGPGGGGPGAKDQNVNE